MSQVVIGDILPYTQATAILNQVVYGTNWTANAASDVVVYSRISSADPDDAAQILSYPSQYSVAFIGALQQVQVTLVAPSLAGDIVTVTRQTPADRMNLYTNTNFIPSMLNTDFGILTLVDQQAQLVDQKIAPRYNYSAVIVDVVDTILPILGANEFWAKNPSNTGFIAVDVSTIIAGGTVTQINTGTGLTGGPITTTGTISFASIAANSFWANITGSAAVPTVVPTTYFLKSANNLSDLANTATARTNLGVAIGVDVQAYSASLTSLAGVSTSANEIPYLTASNTWSVMAAAANAVLITSAGSVPSLSSTLPSAVQTNITKLGTQSQALNMNSHQINNVTDPTNPQDAATLAYVTAQTSGLYLPLLGGTMGGIINMGNHKITNLTDPSSAQDAVTLAYLNSSSGLGGYLPLSGGTMTGAINMGSHKVTNVTDPTNPQDAATKNYVDTFAAGITIKTACYAASTATLTVTYANGAAGIGATLTNAGAMAAFSIDGVSPPITSRILIKDQSSTFQNGVYTLTTVGSGAANWVLTRATDYDQPAEIQPGNLFVINNGTANGGASFIETASVSVIGTDPILFSQFTFSATSVLLKANNLSDVANTTTSFNNISPLTTKGDLLGFSTLNIRVAVGGTNTQILQVDSSAAAGFSWSTATYPKTTTANQILYSSATNTVTGLATLAGGVLVTDASSVPSLLTNPAVAGKILQSANAAIPAWSTPTYPSTSGTAGKMLISDGTNNVYSTPTFPNTAPAAGKILVGDGTNWIQSTPTFPNASATAGKLIISDGTNWIASTPTYPNTSGTSRKLLVANGTNVIYTTETWAVPGAAGEQLTSDGTNWVSSAAGSSILTLNHIFVGNASNVAVDVAMSGDATIVASGALTIAANAVTNAKAAQMATLTIKGNNTGGTANSLDLTVAQVNTMLGTLSANQPTINQPNIVGVTDASNAAAGSVGETIESQIVLASAVSCTNGTARNVTSISLTAGDWDVYPNATFNQSGVFTSALVWCSSTSATLPDDSLWSEISGTTSLAENGLSGPSRRFNVNSTTTVYLSVYAAFSTGAVTACGKITARRRR